MIQSGDPVEGIPLWSRPWIASDAVVFYLEKNVWPVSLSMDYGRTPRWLLAHPVTAIACVLPVVLLLFAWILRNRFCVIAVAMVLYLVMLLPNSGLVAFDYQRVSNVADRYAYLAMVAIALGLAGGLAQVSSHVPLAMIRRVIYSVVISLLVFWAILTTLQLRTWRNGIALFNHAVKVNPDSSYCYQCLAQAYLTAQDPAAALAAATRSIQLNPANDQFRDQFRAMESVHPGSPVVPPTQYASAWAEAAEAHVSRANALDGLNRLSEAADELTIATQMNPGNVIAITDLAFVLGRSGHDAQAQALLHRALQIDRLFAPARAALARTRGK